MSPDDTYRWVGEPVGGPMPLVVVTDGWIEASEAMARVNEIITHQADLETLVEFEPSVLFDQRSRRPSVNLVDGLIRDIDWPSLKLSLGTDRDDRPFLFLHGSEPDLNWQTFINAATTVAVTAGADAMYTLAAYPVPAPHTRPIRVSTVSTCADLLAGRDHQTGAMTVPAGIQLILGNALADHGVHLVALFAQVPYYISTTPWPQAAVDLFDALAEVAKLEFDLTGLKAQQPDAAEAVATILADSPGLNEVVAELEQRHDDLLRIEADAGTGDDLEAQLQEYLREIDET